MKGKKLGELAFRISLYYLSVSHYFGQVIVHNWWQVVFSNDPEIM